jgi:aminodeoxyfutalosine deaminase
LWTGSGLPQRHGAVSVALANDSTASLDVSIGNYCIVPGLINSHTHLDLSDIASPIAATEHFSDWLKSVVHFRSTNSQNSNLESVAAADLGWKESLDAGVQYVLDISHPRIEDNCERSAIRRTLFSELISTKASRAKQTWKAAIAASKNRALPGEFGLSPHAPYTTTRYVVKKAAERCRQESWPLMMHLAESQDEVEWLQTGSGPLQDFMEQVVGEELLSTKQRLSMVEYVDALSRASCSFLVHGNYLDEPSLDLLQKVRERVSIVYCPRTHAHFGHDAYPLQKLFDLGIDVYLGTDSRASNPDLSILSEARFVRQLYPWTTAEQIFRMMSICPRKHLEKVGFSKDIGWTAIPCESQNPSNVLEQILEDNRPASTIDSIVTSFLST